MLRKYGVKNRVVWLGSYRWPIQNKGNVSDTKVSFTDGDLKALVMFQLQGSVLQLAMFRGACTYLRHGGKTSSEGLSMYMCVPPQG